jgi:hypothetical protein
LKAQTSRPIRDRVALTRGSASFWSFRVTATAVAVACVVIAGVAVGVLGQRLVQGPIPPVLERDAAADLTGTGDGGSRARDQNGATTGTPRETAEAAAPPTDTVADPATSDGGFRTYENTRYGYGFMHPGDWTITSRGPETHLRSSDGTVVFTFGPAPDGALPDAAAAVADEHPALGNIQILSSHEETTEQGLSAWVVGGIGQDADGQLDRFISVSIAASDGNRAILVRFPQGPAVLDLLPQIRAVIATYRVTDP